MLLRVVLVILSSFCMIGVTNAMDIKAGTLQISGSTVLNNTKIKQSGASDTASVTVLDLQGAKYLSDDIGLLASIGSLSAEGYSELTYGFGGIVNIGVTPTSSFKFSAELLRGRNSDDSSENNIAGTGFSVIFSNFLRENISFDLKVRSASLKASDQLKIGSPSVNYTKTELSFGLSAYF